MQVTLRQTTHSPVCGEPSRNRNDMPATCSREAIAPLARLLLLAPMFEHRKLLTKIVDVRSLG